MACINQLPPAFWEDCQKSRRTPKITEVTITKEMNPKIVEVSIDRFAISFDGGICILRNYTDERIQEIRDLIEYGVTIQISTTQSNK